MTHPYEARWVSNRRLRRAFLESTMTPADLAHALEWFQGETKWPDETRALRALGLKPCTVSRGGGQKVKKRVTKKVALELADALGLYPAELNL